MCKRILLFVAGVVMLSLFIPTSARAIGTITNTAKLDYKDTIGGTYTATELCNLILKSPPNIVIEKKGRNITRNGTYTDPVVGTSTEIIEYKLVLTNTGEEAAKFVVVKDTLPAGITFQSDAYGTGKGIKVDGVVQTNAQGDDSANYNSSTNTIIVGKNEVGDNGNAIEITLDSHVSMTILYRVKID